ncbi:MAG: tail fiber protein [Candidatus Wallbacteria bacterium]|nr:tail fiber protein [Candidatus Wallbacteria bacterium]
MADPFIGEIRIYPYTFMPDGWLLCNGQTYPIQQYQALFAILGYNFGGDNKSVFAVPNFCPGMPSSGTNSVPIGAGQGPGLTDRQLSQSGGSNQVTISQAQMPSHSHIVSAANFDGELSTPANNFLSSEPKDQLYMSAPVRN